MTTELPHLSATVKGGFALPGEGAQGGEGLRLLLSPSLLAELLPHLGGFQLEGHQAALPAQVSGRGVTHDRGPLLPHGHIPGCPAPAELPPRSLRPRTTVLAAVAFLDAFQKVADMATNTRGRVLPAPGLGVPGLGWAGGWLASVPCGTSPAHVAGVGFKQKLHHPWRHIKPVPTPRWSIPWEAGLERWGAAEAGERVG